MTTDRLAITFWGVRGSIACPGPTTVRYGGNTPCLEVHAAGRHLIFDAGTGLLPLGRNIAARAAKIAALGKLLDSVSYRRVLERGFVLVADGVATSSHAAGAHDLLDLHPVLTAGSHSLVVTFTNDAWGGTAATDRNLYVDAISFNGIDLGKQAALLSAGDANFTFTSAAAVVVPVVPANDTLHIGLSADSWQGDPRFLIFIDGKQVGLEHSAAASHAAGQVEFLDVLVPHTAGVHELDVRFTNDAWGGTAATDRNLYVDSVALNGVDLHAQAALLSAGDAVFAF